MARNSRLWQDSLAHITSYEGEISEGVKWVGWAQQKLQFMLHNTAGALSAVFYPASDVTVKIDTRPNRIHIATKSGGIYMESGFIDFVATGKCTEAAYRPGTLNYNAKVIAELPSPTPLQGKVRLKKSDLPESPFAGELLVDGSTSLAVGCKESGMSQEIVTPDPCNVTYSNGGYCGLELQQRKDCMQNVPASIYTGKLRLFVQAMYGSTRVDFSKSGSMLTLKDQSGTVYPNPKDGSITLGNTGINQCYWLYTIGDGGYALCYLMYPNLIMIPLLLNDTAKKFAETLATHPNKSDFKFATKVEAYILAYAQPVYDSTQWLSIPISGGMPSGDPLSYGWHTNWKGDQAHIVTFYADQVNNRFLSNQYKLTITQAVNGSGNVSFTCAIVNTEANKPFNNWSTALHLFYYDESTLQMMPVAKPTSTPPALFNFDAPVYCFTRLDLAAGDCTLHTIRAYRNFSTPTNYYSIDNSVKTQFIDYVYEERRTYSGDRGTTGFKLVTDSGTTSYTGTAEVLTAYRKDSRYKTTGGYGVTGAGQDYYNTGPNPWWTGTNWSYSGIRASLYVRPLGGGSEYAFLNREYMYYTQIVEEESGSVTKNVSSFIEAPKGACDSVVIGVQEQLNRTGSNTTTTWINRGYKTRDQKFMEAVFDTGAGTYVQTGVQKESASGQGIAVHVTPVATSIGGDNYQQQTGPATSIVNQSPGNYYTTKIYDICGSEPVTIGATSSSLGDTRYFAPSASSPGTGTVDEMQTSIMSGAYSNHTLYDKDYGFIKNTSVGWA